MAQIVLSLVQYASKFSMEIRWYRALIKERAENQLARAINVGLPEAIQVVTFDRGSSVQPGMVVPEADRKMHRTPLAVIKRSAIEGIDIVNDLG